MCIVLEASLLYFFLLRDTFYVYFTRLHLSKTVWAGTVKHTACFAQTFSSPEKTLRYRIPLSPVLGTAPGTQIGPRFPNKSDYRGMQAYVECQTKL